MSAALPILNTSSQDQTILPGDDNNQMTFASAYIQYDVTYMLWCIVPPALLVLGCYGNVMTIVVMRAMRASESTGSLSVYFTALAVSDLILLWTGVLWYWPEIVLQTPLAYFHDLSCAIPVFVNYVSSMTSAWFLVAMTCQRMTSVVWPHRVDAVCTVGTGRTLTAVIVTTSCVLNLHILFYYHVDYVEEVYPSCVISDKDVANIFGWLYVCVSSASPFVLLLVANCVLIHAALQSIKMSVKMAAVTRTHTSSRLARVSSMTTTLILTSVAFLVLTLPSAILVIYLDMVGYYEGGIDDVGVNQRLALADTVCLLLWMSNSAVNFYIYILSGRKFRQETKRYLCICVKHQRKSMLHDGK